MKYFYEKKLGSEPEVCDTIRCNHPMFSSATLYLIGSKGLLVVEQYFDPMTKTTYWGPIEPGISNDIYQNPRFQSVFEKYSGPETEDKLYPVVTLRKLMWALRMKPLKRQYWEGWNGGC